MPFNHENLIVYQRTLPFNVKVGVWTDQWDARHALCDQLSRAAASMLENIAVASAAYSTMKLRFHHETLDVYKVGIEAATAFSSSDSVSRLPNPVFRRLDQLLTSMVLNIAEGNGRFSDADQARFLGTSHESAIKLAARLDLCVTQNLLPLNEVVGWKALLERVSVMTSSMIVGIQR